MIVTTAQQYREKMRHASIRFDGEPTLAKMDQMTKMLRQNAFSVRPDFDTGFGGLGDFIPEQEYINKKGSRFVAPEDPDDDLGINAFTDTARIHNLERTYQMKKAKYLSFCNFRSAMVQLIAEGIEDQYLAFLQDSEGKNLC